jgi:hypothetical protein
VHQRGKAAVVNVAEEIARLSAVQRHVLLRCSDAEDWGSSGYGMARSWPDLVSHCRWAQHRTLEALAKRGIVIEDPNQHGYWRLTRFGLILQLHLRQKGRR